jgi:hypothetical protein
LGVRSQTAGKPPVTKRHDVPAVQLGLFLEAGANLAAQTAQAGASKEQVEAILRRAGGQAGALVDIKRNALVGGSAAIS